MSSLRWMRTLAVVGCIGTALNSVAFVYLLVDSRGRRDQSCQQMEQKQADAVTSLKLTYELLSRLSPEQRREPLNAILLRELPLREGRVRSEMAPAFCDKPGIGLPEPGPRIPERPKGL